MAYEIVGWEYESTEERPEGVFMLTVTDGINEYSFPLPGVYVPGDDVPEEIEAALAAMEDLARLLQRYAAEGRKTLLPDRS